MLIRAAIYARFSSDKQSDSSIDDQVHRARAYLTQRGVDADRAVVFTDYAVSGASMNRAGMSALETAIRANQLDLLITESVDRLSRDVGDADRFRKLLTHHGCTLECLDGTKVSNGKGDALMFSVRAIFAEQYRLDLADKTLRGLEGNARNSRPTGGVPYGYRIKATPTADPKRPVREIEIDPERAAVVRRIFADAQSGLSCGVIAATLNAEGVTTPRAHSRRVGQGWMASAVRSMLLNESYTGRWIYGKRQWVKPLGSNKRQPKVRRSGALVTQERPELTIIDRATFLAVGAPFEARKGTRAKRGSRRFVLSGLLKCACGAGMSIYGAAPYYRCAASKDRGTCPRRRHIRLDSIERKFTEVLGAQLRKLGPRLLQLAAEETAIARAAVPDLEVALRQDMARRARQIDALVNTLAEVPTIATAKRIRELEGVQAAAERELALMHAPPVQLASPAEYAARVVALEGIFDGLMPLERARADLAALVGPKGIVCSPLGADDYELKWSIHPGPLLQRTGMYEPGGCGGALCRNAYGKVAGLPQSRLKPTERFVDQPAAVPARPTAPPGLLNVRAGGPCPAQVGIAVTAGNK